MPVGGVGVPVGGVVVAHMEPSSRLLWSVIAAVLANRRPRTEAALFRVMAMLAITLPANAVVVPSVAELPTSQ